MSEYKTIVLQQGLEDVAVDDYQFRKIKSLLRKELNLTEKMQNDYDRIQMADLLEDTFPKDAGLDKLIEVCQSIKDLEELAQRLKTERAKVQKKGKNKTAVKKRKQEEPSSSRSLSTDNELDMSKPSSEEMRKETIKTEGSKKMKFTQEQTQLPEPSGSNTQKDEGCLQTPQKPIPKPSSSSSNKKNTSSKKHNTIETQVSQKKHQLLELSATNNSSAVSELQTLQGLSATASHSIQAPQAPLETCFTLKMPLGSAALSYQNFPGSLASNSNIHLNSPVALTLSSGIQAPHVPSATPCSNVWILQMPSETVSSSFSAPQMAPVSVSSSAQNIHLPTAVAANSKQFPHSPQVITSRCVQSTGVPSAPLKVIKKPPTKQSSNVQVLHALPEAMSRNVCITQVPQITTSSSILTPNSATVKAHRNAKVPGLLEIGSAYSLAFLASPGTSSSSLQASQVLLQATSNSLPAPQVSIPTVTSRVQTTQTHPGAASNVIQDLHAPPWTESRSVCTTQGPQGVSYGTGQAVPCPKVKVSRRVHAPQMPSATASKNLLDSRVSPATAFSALQAPLRPPATRSSSPSRTPNNGNLPKEPSKVQGHHRVAKEVMVLKATEPFTYDLINNKRMFHATVATETEFFRVKVFETALKNKFIPKKIIAISDYTGVSGFLEIHKASCVSEQNVKQTMVISSALRRRANRTPKIKDLFSQTKGTYVNGEFEVTKKNERNDFIYYGIEDDTGKMEVVVSGPLTCIKCEPGNKVQLICFELTSRGDTWQLKSVTHSYMQVINARRRAIQP